MTASQIAAELAPEFIKAIDSLLIIQAISCLMFLVIGMFFGWAMATLKWKR